MQQLVLGTAQLGMDYGINNSKGKPSLDETFAILDFAYDNGVRFLDTASFYGNSEEIIGSYVKKTGKTFSLCTKLKKLGSVEECSMVENEIFSSLRRLNIAKIDYYYAHSFDNIVEFPQILEVLNDYKNQGVLSNIGVSIYEPAELEWLILHMHKTIDMVQIPFNLFDHRWIKGDILVRAKQAGIKVFARSIFLQGLLLMSDEDNPMYKKAYNYLFALDRFCSSYGITREKLAMRFVKSCKNIDFILAGCESKKQLADNIELFKDETELNSEEKSLIYHNFHSIEEDIIDPRKWLK